MKTAFKEPNICPQCKVDRDVVAWKLGSPNVWIEYPDGKDGFWGKSDEHLIAERFISKCSACQEFFYGGLNG